MERTRASSRGSETTIGFGERVRAPATHTPRALSTHTRPLVTVKHPGMEPPGGRPDKRPTAGGGGGTYLDVVREQEREGGVRELPDAGRRSSSLFGPAADLKPHAGVRAT
jgi:hypothetical protein